MVIRLPLNFRGLRPTAVLDPELPGQCHLQAMRMEPGGANGSFSKGKKGQILGDALLVFSSFFPLDQFIYFLNSIYRCIKMRKNISTSFQEVRLSRNRLV